MVCQKFLLFIQFVKISEHAQKLQKFLTRKISILVTVVFLMLFILIVNAENKVKEIEINNTFDLYNSINVDNESKIDNSSIKQNGIDEYSQNNGDIDNKDNESNKDVNELKDNENREKAVTAGFGVYLTIVG